jgi:hypothetical protein
MLFSSAALHTNSSALPYTNEQQHIPSPSGDLSTNPPIIVFMQIKIFGLSVGNKCVTKVSGWDDDASSDDVDIEDKSLSGSSRAVIS